MKAFTRIDTLYMEFLKTYIELTNIVQILLHENACAEAGVSINEGIMLSENMSEEALVALWVIYDGVVNSGGLENIKVAKEMMKYVDKAHSQYYHHLKTSKEDQTIRSKEGREKKVELWYQKSKRSNKKTKKQLQRKASEHDSQIFHLEEQLRKQYFFSNFSVTNIVFIFLGKVEVVWR